MGKRNWHWHLGNSPNDHILPAGDVARALKASRTALRESGHDTCRTVGETRALRACPPRWLIHAQERQRAHRAQVVRQRARREQEEENRLLAADDYLFLLKGGVDADKAVGQVHRKWGLRRY